MRIASIKARSSGPKGAPIRQTENDGNGGDPRLAEPGLLFAINRPLRQKRRSDSSGRDALQYIDCTQLNKMFLHDRFTQGNQLLRVLRPLGRLAH